MTLVSAACSTSSSALSVSLPATSLSNVSPWSRMSDCACCAVCLSCTVALQGSAAVGREAEEDGAAAHLFERLSQLRHLRVGGLLLHAELHLRLLVRRELLRERACGVLNLLEVLLRLLKRRDVGVVARAVRLLALHLGVELALGVGDLLLVNGLVSAGLVRVTLVEAVLQRDERDLVLEVRVGGLLAGLSVEECRSSAQLVAKRKTRQGTDLERALLFLDELDAVHLDLAVVSEPLNLESCLLNERLVPRRADDVLEVLEQALFVVVGALGLHLRNRLDLTLQSVRDGECKDSLRRK